MFSIGLSVSLDSISGYLAAPVKGRETKKIRNKEMKAVTSSLAAAKEVSSDVCSSDISFITTRWQFYVKKEELRTALKAFLGGQHVLALHPTDFDEFNFTLRHTAAKLTVVTSTS